MDGIQEGRDASSLADGLITASELARKLKVRHDTVRHWVSIYKPTRIQGVYHFGRAVRFDYPTFVEAFPDFLQTIRAGKRKRSRSNGDTKAH